MNEYVVATEGLTRRFGDFLAVDHLDLSVAFGEIFAFLGPNGAGKSTTIKMLTGLLKPTSGLGSVGGFDIYREAEQIKANIGYMSQRFSLYHDLTPAENLTFFGGIYKVPRAKLKLKMEMLFDTTQLGASQTAPTETLPLGLKQRLALECAMLHDPPILFLDEPTAGVDPIARRGFWDIINAAARQGTTVFLTTHYMDEAEHADRVALIFSGGLTAVGTPLELKRNFAGGKIYRLETDDPALAVERLSGAGWVKGATAFGSSLHLTAAAEIDLNKATEFIRACGVPISKLSSISPTLEDVFISLTEGEAKA